QDGLLVKIQKRTRSGTFHTVAHTTLTHSSASRSSYSRRLRIQRTGTYRTLAASAAGAVAPGTSNAVSIDVSRCRATAIHLPDIWSLDRVSGRSRRLPSAAR